MGEATMYSQPSSRLSVPGNFFDTSSSASMQMPPLQTQPDQDSYDLYTTSTSQAMAHHQPQASQTLQPSAPYSRRASSGAWSRDDDHQLLEARSKGLNWAQVKNQFPNKSANACRKRHERLMEHRDADEWDNRKLEQLAKEYMMMRKEIWGPLAARVGEKWNVVEQKVRAWAQVPGFISPSVSTLANSSLPVHVEWLEEPSERFSFRVSP